jgi:hypothetical protein
VTFYFQIFNGILCGIKVFVQICRNPYASSTQPSKGYKAFLDLLIVGSPSFFASFDEGCGDVIRIAQIVVLRPKDQ